MNNKKFATSMARGFLKGRPLFDVVEEVFERVTPGKEAPDTFHSADVTEIIEPIFGELRIFHALRYLQRMEKERPAGMEEILSGLEEIHSSWIEVQKVHIKKNIELNFSTMVNIDRECFHLEENLTELTRLGHHLVEYVRRAIPSEFISTTAFMCQNGSYYLHGLPAGDSVRATIMDFMRVETRIYISICNLAKMLGTNANFTTADLRRYDEFNVVEFENFDSVGVDTAIDRLLYQFQALRDRAEETI